MKVKLLLSLLWAVAATAVAQEPGDFLIAEYMANPEHVPDDVGEYIELYNTRPYPVTLQGCTLQDGSGLQVNIDQSIWIPGYQLAVIGGIATPGTIFVYPSSPPPFSLNNIGGDQIILSCNGTVVAQTVYTATQSAGQAKELISTIGYPSGFTPESAYRDADDAFQYNGASNSENGSPTHLGSTFALPVELSRFEASANQQSVRLEWSTETELNNSHFELEHSTNGRQFTSIKRIEGYGNSQTPQHYTFVHHPKQAGLQYYRLAQYDFDGTRTYSDIISVRLHGHSNLLQAFPSNTHGPLHLKWETPTPSDGQLLIYNAQGQLQHQLELPIGSRAAALDLHGLSPGAYIAQIHLGRATYSTRFFKI
jgi:hypothetical protein